ncbi:hypothetical protein PRIPAC_93504 [Pristionchus pacificus]|uniref:Transmembrane ion channel n=1 Tax=Pristionchus pacificus TaxID=54126 RepID=A0A2A6BPD2_PRIPA|nr:hypothetical protein PRIPAC_93504 [Pristionchus pacificus]|eukprot:PDM67686.1 transmembrane ion channel [Pristionchus pacificus]
MRLLFILFLVLVSIANGEVDSDEVIDKFESIQEREQPKTVNISVLIHRIDNIGTPRDSVTLHMVLLQEWEDSRRKFKGSENIAVESANLNTSNWTPLLYFPSVLKTDPFTVYKTISPNRKVETRQAIQVTIPCRHNAWRFPSDEYSCQLRIESQHRDNVVITWMSSHDSHMMDSVEEVKIASPFKVSRIEHSSRADSTTKNEGKNMKHLIVDIGVKREAGSYYWFSSIQPSIFLLVLTWTSLFLNREKFILLRISLALVSLFAVQALNFVVNSEGRSSGGQGNVVDFWMQLSSLLIFIILIENVIIAILSTRKRKETEEGVYFTDRSKHSDVEKLPEAMDYLAKVFFPLVATLVLIITFFIIYF